MNNTSRTVRGWTHLPHCLVARYGDTGDDFPWCTCKTDGWPRRIVPAEEDVDVPTGDRP